MKAITTILILSAAFTSGAGPLVLRATISLPGVKGRFDHFAVDTNMHRLFIAALGNNTLEIIDGMAAKRLHTITGLHKPTGVAFLTQQNQIVVANGDDGTAKIFDGENYKLTREIPGLDDADNVRFDVKANRIYVGYSNGALAAINVEQWQQAATIQLKDHPESFQLEPNGDRIFVNVPGSKEVAVVDRKKKAVVANWPMKDFQANFPMALDEANQRLFIGCRQPARLVVLETTTGKVVSDVAISGDTDDLFYDSKLKRIYISCGEGFVDVVDQRAPDLYQLRERIPTRAGARTSFFSTDLNQLYLAVPQRGKQDAEIRVFQTQP